MTRFSRYLPTKPSRRSVRNSIAAAKALYAPELHGASVEMEAAPVSNRSGPRGRQPESAVNDAVKQWAKLRNGVMYRNRRGMVGLASGAKMPIGLGPNGYGDLVGYLTIQVTPEMLGRHIAVYTMIESKVRGVPEEHQQVCIDEVRAAGGIAGCARNAEDAEQVLVRWRQKRARG